MKRTAGTQEHHTLADWDSCRHTEYLNLENFISPPSSLSTTNLDLLLCRVPTTLCLPEGRVVTWVHVWPGGWAEVYFRSQYPLGEADFKAAYFLWLRPYYNARFYHYINGGVFKIGEWDWKPSWLEWFRVRLTWWNGETPEAEPALAVQLEIEEAGDWHDYGILYHVPNLWKDSPVNRVGVACIVNGTCHDDTEIWRER